MDDFNEDKIDLIFQEGAERYDFTYREDAWASMDEMLDKQDKKKKYRFFGWWLAVGVVAVALIGVFGLKYFTSSTEKVLPEKRMEQNVEPKLEQDQNIAPREIASTTNEKLNTTDKTNGLVESQTQTTAAVLAEKEKSETTLKVDNKKAELTATDLPTSLDKKNLTVETISTEESKKKIVSQKQERVFSTVPESERLEQHTNPKLPLLPIEEPILQVHNADYLSSINLPAITLNNNEIEENENPKSRNRFSVGLTFGPEYSFVGGGTNQGKAGYYLGLELGYQISERFELITGVGVSKKTYLASGDNYKTSPGFWTDGIAPTKFDGTCTVIEIPLAANYYFSGVNENGFFASLGATSYIMSSEWYDFIYDPSITRTDLKANWNDKLANNHILGVGQVSFGYQHNLGKHTSVQISPYAKIPLTGIGHGSVNLFSTGIRLTARLK